MKYAGLGGRETTRVPSYPKSFRNTMNKEILKLTEIEVTPNLTLSDVETDLQVLPYYLREFDEKLETINRQLADQKHEVQRLRSVHYIHIKDGTPEPTKQKVFKAPAVEINMRVNVVPEVVAAEKKLIELEHQLAVATWERQYYDNRFTAIRKIASIRELELKRGY